ncbi:DNA adenine methylase [Afifella aestuarii]|uniref:DNA adenine methylase n=1 Tax=Afifella aestuarii TaxID=1909496 RepID=UPI000FE2CF6B|nr:DNA adenine methylase [Afifella aestuarii]
MVETLRPVPQARAVAPYVGGKRQLSRRIAAQIEATPHSLYAEVFAGMAGVFFKRRLAPKVEVLNDLDRDVSNLFRVLQNHPAALMDLLGWQLASVDEFKRLIGQDPEYLTDLQRAARFLFLQRLAFGGKVVGQNFGRVRRDPARFRPEALKPILEAAHRRLQGVWIDCLSWEVFLDRWDRPDALFYLDPPYWGTEHYYGEGLFSRSDFARLAARLSALQGRFILSINDVPEIRQLFSAFDFEEVDVTYSLQGSSNDVRAGELIISGGGDGSQ